MPIKGRLKISHVIDDFFSFHGIRYFESLIKASACTKLVSIQLLCNK